MSKLQKRRLTVLGSISVVAIGLAVFTSVQFYITITKLEKNYKEFSGILEKLKEDERELKTDIKKLNDPDYIAKYARENYLYSKEGEYVIKIDEEEKLVIEETKKSKNDTFIISLAISIGSVLFLLIIIKLFSGKKKIEA